MTQPVGSARVEVVGDVSRFARDVQTDLNRILARIRLDPVEVRGDFDRIEREARDAGGDIERVFETSGEEIEDAFRETGNEAERQFDRMEREARDAGGRMRRVLGAAAVGIGAAFAAVQIGQFLRDSVLAADDLSDAMAISEQIIGQTGGAAGLLADEIREISQGLSLEIGVDSAQVQSAANVLLTFRNVSEDTFDTALGLAADLSTVLGTDLNGATLQLGKALNDPVRGIAALARAGVQFTQSQKDQIKALVESGDLLGAQTIILEELEGQVGGTAAAAADSWSIVTNAFRETQRELGAALIPAIDALAPALITVAESLGPVLGAIGTTLADALTALAPSLAVLGGALADALAQIDLTLVGEALGAVVEALAPLLPVIGRLIGTLLPPLAQIIGALAGPLAVVADVIASLLTEALVMLEPHLPLIVDLFRQIAVVMAENLQQTLPIISELLLELLAAILPLTPDLVELALALLPLMQNSESWVSLLTLLSDLILMAVLPSIQQLAALLNGDLAGAFPMVTAQIKAMRMVVEAVFRFVRDFVGDSVDRLRSILGGIRGIVSNVIGFFGNLRSGISDRVNAVLDLIRGIPMRIRGALGNLGNLLRNAGLNVIQGFIDGITSAFGRVQDTLSRLTSFLPDWKGPAEVDRAILREAGRNVLQGFQRGISDERDNVRRLLGEVTGDIGAAPFMGSVAGGDGASAGDAGGAGTIEVRVFIGDRELTDMVRVEIGEHDRQVRRRVQAGAGRSR